MTNERAIKSANEVYNTIRTLLQEKQWSFTESQKSNNLVIKCKTYGDDLPIPFQFYVNTDKCVATLSSPFNFKIPKSILEQVALIINAINTRLVEGKLCYDIIEDTISFRSSIYFEDSLISKNAISNMLYTALCTIDLYNDKLLSMVQEQISYDDMLAFIQAN